MINTMQVWHEMVAEQDPAKLDVLLAEDAVMISPVVHTHQRGKSITKKYLLAAMHVLGGDDFRYVREVSNEDGAVLEFETEIDGVFVNGVDIISWNSDGQITEFKVMVRPLKGMQAVHKKMGELLEKMVS